MQLSCEAPLSWMKEVSKHIDYEYALAHHFLDDEYIEHFKDAISNDKKVILDNSAFELGESFSSRRLLSIFAMLQTEEHWRNLYIIAPDVLGDKQANTFSIEMFLKEARPFIQLSQIYGTIQGGDIRDRLESYKELSNLGISKFTVPAGWHIENGEMIREPEFTRVEFFNLLDNKENHEFHLLGCQDLISLKSYREFTHVKSIDTSYPVALTLQNEILVIDNNKPTIKINDVYNLAPPEATMKFLLGKNIENFKKLM